MEFHVSNEHVRRERRKAVYLILFLAVISSALIAKVLSTEKISDLVYPIIGLLVLSLQFFGSYKRIREGKAAYPVLELDEPNGKVAVLYKDLKVIVDLSQIKNLRLQRKSGQLVSILVYTSSGEDLRFDGYENLDVLASALERLAPKESITNASFYHR
ncbi:hypothetical protein [Rhodoferax antarcticus]|uniref:Transmembrane protein n=1 Tax=Rhodoferax antarcticus ANT.BR TaxID=1111071 RepID=A0A1Q8YGV3_9BURK|nr:hypothetical protein [Rhodoferax antarcticus]APW45366.1 hypothetical protein RA876_02145 [Rhodoferax antarcticus]MCW2314408.1 hypothetical protein [Rhodoferax antarcticus]OLP07149.1 hypothetical protein BLL52_1545 [Rhodoferax antarcticus ANT.BR]